jgi:hypothetical protein
MDWSLRERCGAARLPSPGGPDERAFAGRNHPPHHRAFLGERIGAIGQQLGKNRAALRRLRDSLNPFSRFDFGLLAGLQHARDWQAKERR